MIEINICSSNALPYVEIKHPKLKLLIDTGSSRSILKPSIVENFFPNCIYQTTNIIKTAIGQKSTKYQADLSFPEFGSNHKIKFILFDFHDYFDGVIGLKDLINMNLNIDLTNKRLINNFVEIPFKYRQPEEINFSFSINPHEKLIKKVPVNIFQGEIITRPKEEFDYNIKYKKGKQNQAADALSRIPINNQELNALETESIDNNPGDIDEVIEELIKNRESLPDIEEKELEEILGIKPKPKIIIHSDIQIRPPNPIKKKESTDLETRHTSLEEPIIGLPISERSLNTYKNQVIFTYGEIDNIKCRHEQIFKNTRIYVTISQRRSTENFVKFLKEFIDPKQTYAMYFKDQLIARNFIITLQKLFKNTAFNFIQCSKFLNDIETLNEQKEKLEMYHTTKTCHRGINEMKNALTSKFYWPKMSEDIENYVNNCETCQKNKYDRSPPIVKFNLTPTTSKPFEQIHIDTFKISNESFLTIIDAFSRYGQAYHLNALTGPTIIENLYTFITHHGLPLKITTDCGTEFKNKEVEDFCKLYKIEIHYTTPKNSTSNSPVERFHSSLIEHYRCLKSDHPNLSPSQLIKRSILGYNNSIHSVTKHTPFEIIKGHINNTDPFDLNDEIIVSNYIQKHKEQAEDLYRNIQSINARTKELIITKRNEKRQDPPEFLKSDVVYIKTKARGKDQPKFKKATIEKEDQIKLITNKGTYHKSLARKPKVKKKSNFQENNDGEDPDPADIPGTSHEDNSVTGHRT